MWRFPYIIGIVLVLSGGSIATVVCRHIRSPAGVPPSRAALNRSCALGVHDSAYQPPCRPLVGPLWTGLLAATSLPGCSTVGTPGAMVKENMFNVEKHLNDTLHNPQDRGRRQGCCPWLGMALLLGERVRCCQRE